MENNRNYFVAIALSVLILVAWQFLYVNPKLEKDRAALEAQQAAQAQQTTTSADGTATTTTATSGTLPGGAATGTTTETREAAIAKSARVEIDTPSLSGSINLTGARFDDLKLKEFHETVDKTSPIITLLSPAETEHGYFAEVGYVGSDATGTVPGPQTVWTQDGTGKLTQTTPVKLTFTNDKGVLFTRTISVDEHYMFTIADSIENRTDAAIALSAYGRSTRFFKPTAPSVYVLHEGFIGVLGDLGLHEVKYKETEEDTTVAPGKATGGWLGITDKYWATALVPPQATPYETRFSYFQDGRPRYQADYRQDDITIAPGQKADVKNLFFGGAKEVPIIDGYKSSYGIPHFDLMIDCYMSLTVPYTIQLTEALRPYRIRWIEEPLPPDDYDGHARIKAACPWQQFTTGEHEFSRFPVLREQDLDQVAGYVHVRDLLYGEEGPKSLEKILREPLFVPVNGVDDRLDALAVAVEAGAEDRGHEGFDHAGSKYNRCREIYPATGSGTAPDHAADGKGVAKAHSVI